MWSKKVTLLTLFIFVFLGNVFCSTDCRPKTADDIVSLVTRRELFAENNVDYMLSLNSKATGNNAYVDIGPISFGESSSLNLFVSVYMDTISSYSIFHAFKSDNPQQNFRVGIKNKNTFTFTLGTKSFDVPKLTGRGKYADDEDWDGSNPSLVAGDWNHINIDFTNLDDSSVSVYIYVNKRYWNTAVVKNTFVSDGIRDNAFLGANANSASALENFFVGYMDNFALFSVPSTKSWRTSCRTLPFALDTTRVNNVQLLMDFNDALVSIGTTTVAITRTIKPDIFWVVAVLKSGASFIPRSDLERFFECTATGDPHGLKREWPATIFTKIVNLEDQGAGHVFVRCGGDPGAASNASELEVRTYTRFTHWWRWAVFRLIGIRYIDYIYRINLDEITSGIENPTEGYRTPKLNIPAGVFRKHISSETWDPIPYTSKLVLNLEPTTGAQYAHYGSKTLLVKVPGVGDVTVDAADGAFSSCRYMALSVRLNSDLCPKIRRGKSTCDDDLNIIADPLYRDWLPPPPLDDTPPSNVDPCSPLLVDPSFKSEADGICKRIYPSDTNKYNDCMFDACASGDVELILLNKPTPECLLNSLSGGSDDCQSIYCPNFCSFRGDCDSTLKQCKCDDGYVGKDCGQKKSFSCYDLKFGTEKIKVSSQYAPSSVSASAPVYTDEVFGQHGVEGSVLIYTTYSNNGSEHLFVVNNDASGPNPGAYELCITVNSGSISVLAKILKANNNVLGKHTITDGTKNCFQFKWEPYGSGGLIFQLSPISGQLSLTFSISQEDGLKQVLYATPNGKGDLDVLKIPEANHGSFNLDLSVCNADVCAQYDQQCQNCSAQSQCGYCVESGRCMLGDKSGPYAGLCGNWRFSFDDVVSRVVTVEYDATDLVNPATEVYLTSSSGPEEGVPVNIYVPTLVRAYATDAIIIFSTQGDFASNAQQIKRNFANLLSPLSSDNLNLGIGFYDSTGAKLTLPMTRVDPNNFFTFTRAIEAVLGNTGSGDGGQQYALSLAGSGSSVSIGFRQYSKKFAFITVYGYNSADKSSILAQRDIVLNAGFVPIWVLVGDSDSTRDFFQYEIIQDATSAIPGFVLFMQNDASDLASVLRNGISIGSSFPSVVIKQGDKDNNHVDFANLHAETLFISGLSDPGLRAWFRIPMLRGDTLNHVADIVVPGFGRTTISDVSNTKPIAKDNSFSGDEGSSCIQVTLIGSSYKNLLPVMFVITSAPSHGKLFEYDPSKPDYLGTPVNLDGSSVSDGASSSLCYQPQPRFFHGLDSFNFKSFDGCSFSDEATISLVINNINLSPLAFDTSFNVSERQDSSFTDFFKCEGGDEGETIHVFVSEVNVEAPDFVKPVDSKVLFVDGNLVQPLFTGGDTIPVESNNFDFGVNATFKHDNNYFFGKVTYKYQCVDDTNLSSDVHLAVVNIQEIIDPPVITLKDYTPIEDIFYEVKFSVRDFDVPISTIVISEVSKLLDYTISKTSDGLTPVSLPYTCYSGTTDYSASCSFWFKLKEDNANSCPGFTDCVESELQTSVVLQATASDGQSPANSQSSTIALSIYPANDPPVLQLSSPVSTLEFTDKEFDVVLTDPDGDYLNTAYDLVITNPSTFFSTSVVNTKKTANNVVFTVKISPVFNVYGTQVIHIEGYDTITYSVNYDVEVDVLYFNDPPVVVTISKTLTEDTGDYVDITLFDYDNSPSELTYLITNVPEAVIYGVNTPKYAFFDENGNSLDITKPLPGPKLWVVPAKDYFTTDFDEVSFNVTDKNLFGTLPDNVVSSVIRFTVTPVNDPPSCVKPSVVPMEDTAFVVQLAGAETAYGEQNQSFTFIFVMEPYDITSNSTNDQGVFYHYDDRVNSLSVSDFVAIATRVSDGEEIPSGKVVYVPPQDKNSAVTPNSPLYVHPYFQFKVFDGLDSDVCLVVINVVEVNDPPVAWNNPWPGRPDVTYEGIDPTTNFFVTPPSGECVTLCKGLEDHPLNLYLGGQDVDYALSTVTHLLQFKLVSANCVTQTFFQYTDNKNNLQSIPVENLPIVLDNYYEAGLLHPITLIPAPNAFNAPDPSFIHPNVKYSELYCTLEYRVIDSNGVESESQFIDVSIQEQNDLPNCSRGGCTFLQGSNLSDVAILYEFREVTMYEDEVLWLYLNYVDIENDEFFPFAMECDANNGQFFFPNSAEQSLAFNSDGTITDQTRLEANTTTKRVCQSFDKAAPIFTFQSSSHVGNKGYYVKFVPDPNEYGNLYNKLGIIVTDKPNANQVLELIEYYITVLPVNDYPDIYLTSFDNAVGSPVLATNGDTVSFTTYTGKSIKPIALINDIDNIATIPSMTLDIRPQYSDAQASLVVKDINGNDYLVTSPFRYTGSLFQVNTSLTNLNFESQKVGIYKFDISLDDNGATGNCLPSEGQPVNGACPRITKLTIEINVGSSSSISGPLSVVAASGLGAFLVAGFVTGAALIRKFKNKKQEGWKEFDEDNFKDYAQANPLFERKTRSQSNPIYVSSNEEELSNS